MTKLLGIGWDVGGWMGMKQGIAASSFNTMTNEFNWIGLPMNTSLKNHQLWSPSEIVRTLESSVSLEDFDEIVVGIDASLGFPREFKKLVNMERGQTEIPLKEINNAFAYRETERHIYEQFGKKPLSATFDKLGNNTTLALSYALKWSETAGYIIIPQQGNNTSSKGIIEVYPALVKTMEGDIKRELIDLIPKKVPIQSDAYDAAICSLLALIFKGNGQFIENVKLTEPMINVETLKEEGWIYYI